MPTDAPDLTCTLRLSPSGQRSPVIVLTHARGKQVAAIPTSEIAPELPLADASVHSISALDILEHVHDEQTWLGEFARVLAPGGELTTRVPLENPLAWADALNTYRYIADTSGRGRTPREALPTGWHRHYAPGDLPDILRLAGFRVVSTRSEGLPLGELPHLAGLVIGDALLRRPDAERRLFALRARIGRRSRLPLPAVVAARLLVRAVRVTQGFEPEPEVEPDDHHEEGRTEPLE